MAIYSCGCGIVIGDSVLIDDLFTCKVRHGWREGGREGGREGESSELGNGLAGERSAHPTDNRSEGSYLHNVIIM